MELKDFISETISQISQGLVDAQEKTKSHGTVINPPVRSSDEKLRTNKHGISIVAQTVDFDISITVEQTESTNKKGFISVPYLGIGAGKEKEENSQSMNKIKFSIPILFPLGDNYQKE